MLGTAPHVHLLFYCLMAVVSLVVLISRFKLHAFPALLLVSLLMGLCSGMSVSKVAVAFQQGVGAMLGSVAVVVGLGIILGGLLAHSGGAEVIATTLIRALGAGRLPWTLMLIAFLIGLPVFFTVGVVLLAPILFTLVRESGRPLLLLALPVLAGLSVAHGLIPPHPGPMAAIALVHADLGRVIVYGTLVGLPTAAVAGPLFAKWISRRLTVAASFQRNQPDSKQPAVEPPGFVLSVAIVLLPAVLMLLATVANLMLGKSSKLSEWASFVGHPAVAMLAAVLVAYWGFGIAQGLTRAQLLKLTEDSLAPAAAILLVVGAGGGFNGVLMASGIGDAMAEAARAIHFSPLVLGWLVAALIRVATGSATVAITTSAGIVAPFALKVTGCNMDLLVLSMGAGSLILSHVNDGGFWFVKEYLGLTVTETLQTWTVMETLVSVMALILILLLNAVLAVHSFQATVATLICR